MTLFWPGLGLCETPGDSDGWHTAKALRHCWTPVRVDCLLGGDSWQAPQTLKGTLETEAVLIEQKAKEKQLRNHISATIFILYAVILNGKSVCSSTCSFFILSWGCWRGCWRWVCLVFSTAFIDITKSNPGIQHMKQGNFCKRGKPKLCEVNETIAPGAS